MGLLHDYLDTVERAVSTLIDNLIGSRHCLVAWPCPRNPRFLLTLLVLRPGTLLQTSQQGFPWQADNFWTLCLTALLEGGFLTPKPLVPLGCYGSPMLVATSV
jgi:hypothetical protein